MIGRIRSELYTRIPLIVCLASRHLIKCSRPAELLLWPSWRNSRMPPRKIRFSPAKKEAVFELLKGTKQEIHTPVNCLSPSTLYTNPNFFTLFRVSTHTEYLSSLSATLILLGQMTHPTLAFWIVATLGLVSNNISFRATRMPSTSMHQSM